MHPERSRPPHLHPQGIRFFPTATAGAAGQGSCEDARKTLGMPMGHTLLLAPFCRAAHRSATFKGRIDVTELREAGVTGTQIQIGVPSKLAPQQGDWGSGKGRRGRKREEEGQTPHPPALGPACQHSTQLPGKGRQMPIQLPDARSWAPPCPGAAADSPWLSCGSPGLSVIALLLSGPLPPQGQGG